MISFESEKGEHGLQTEACERLYEPTTVEENIEFENPDQKVKNVKFLKKFNKTENSKQIPEMQEKNINKFKSQILSSQN